ncbi:MAG TPA: glycosyltransferase, partial [Actinomycetota bacterium]
MTGERQEAPARSRLGRAGAWLGQVRSDHLVRNSFFIMLATAAMGAFGFLFWLVAARLFTSGEIGVATTLISATILISYLGQFGFDATFVRYLPTSSDRNAEINTGITLVAGGSLLLALAYILVVPSFVPALRFVRSSPLYVTGFAVFTALGSINLVTDAVFIAYRAAKYNFIVDGLIQGVSKVALPALVVGLGAFGIFTASTGAALMAVIASIVLLMRHFGYRPRVRVSRAVIRHVLSFSALNYAASLLNVVPVLFVPAIVINARGASEAGYYYVAFQMANLLFAGSFAISASLFSEGSYEDADLHRLAWRAAKYLGLLAVPAVALLSLGGHWLLLAFGREYSQHAGSALAVFGFAVPAVSLNMWSHVMLRLSRQLGALVWSNVVLVLVVCGLALLWVHRGLTWVALAYVLGNLAAGVAALVPWLAGHRRSLRPGGAPQGAGQRVAAPPSTPPPAEDGRFTVMIVAPGAADGASGADACDLAVALAGLERWRVVLAVPGGRDVGPRGDSADLAVYRLPSFPNGAATAPAGGLLRRSTWRRELRRIIEREAPALVNVHAPSEGLEALIPGLVGRIPFVVSWHGRSADEGGRRGERRMLARAAWIVCPAEQLRDTQLTGIRAKCSTVLPGEHRAASTGDIFEAVAAGRPGDGRRRLAVVAPFFHPRMGGVEQYAYRVARGLNDAGDYDVVVLTSNHAGRRTVVEVIDGLTVFRFPRWFKVSNTPINPLWPLRLRRAIVANRIDLVHAHAPVPFMAEAAAIACGRRPFVLTYHCSLAKGRPFVDVALAAYEAKILPRLLRRADAVVSVSPPVDRWLMPHTEGKAYLVPPGVDQTIFAPAGSPRLDAGATTASTVLYVGRIERASAAKGIRYLLEAFALVHAELPEARLVLVGGGDAVAEHRRFAAALGIP